MVVGALDAPLPGCVARHRRGDAAPARGADRGGARERAAAEASRHRRLARRDSSESLEVSMMDLQVAIMNLPAGGV